MFDLLVRVGRRIRNRAAFRNSDRTIEPKTLRLKNQTMLSAMLWYRLYFDGPIVPKSVCCESSGSSWFAASERVNIHYGFGKFLWGFLGQVVSDSASDEA